MHDDDEHWWFVLWDSQHEEWVHSQRSRRLWICLMINIVVGIILVSIAVYLEGH